MLGTWMLFSWSSSLAWCCLRSSISRKSSSCSSHSSTSPLAVGSALTTCKHPRQRLQSVGFTGELATRVRTADEAPQPGLDARSVECISHSTSTCTLTEAAVRRLSKQPRNACGVVCVGRSRTN
ncbi:hypothetical protein COO60DRAFT_1472745 [Scenedesmus sp. NREL 46B-D3]|nr:hypothetical protein COO60DRAFT_1472745 [Scenedesmus sp. NREL 46B-D3]